MKNIKINEKVPDFELVDDEGNLFKLSDHNYPLMIVFYPGDDTAVCTAQLCDYRDGIDVFRNVGVEVIGISKDPKESHQQFKKKYNLPFRLLTDPQGKVAEQFGCKTLLGTINRAVFLLGKDNILLWYHKEVSSIFRRTKEELVDVINRLKTENKL